eukprot:CAMPEP_0184377312 /NCGR_PEP_ID=MMETSP0007-20130409/2173_1 /TAXON_ID=97485 /ORGANISM="Prymnesium parvum, Strain Texoma1" /LENGTH=103 /DNA_ID=CAMNT_0026721163 /DNA_START=121 /DNA_END=433 /DNA_ORIENTATION=-
MSTLTGIPVYQVVSDVKDFFNQHHLAPEDKHKVGLSTLDPARAIVQHAANLRAAEPALANIAESKRARIWPRMRVQHLPAHGTGAKPKARECKLCLHLRVFGL